MERTFNVTPEVNVVVEQESMGDVNCVVWDSALVAVYAFIHQGPSKWKDKKVLDLGSGTGVCGLVLAALGADVVLTDLPEYLPLLHRNLTKNSQLKEKISIASLDWKSATSPLLSLKYDVVLLVDCVYYSRVVPQLISLLTSIDTAEYLCVFEKRDIGEPVAAQQLFLETIRDHFEVSAVDPSELDNNFTCMAYQQKRRDPATFSNYEEVTITHIDIKWGVDFDSKTLAGHAILKCSVLRSTDKVILDGRDLEIDSVRLVGGETLKFNSESDEVFGSKITVFTGPLEADHNLAIEIKYRTAPKARALQFLSKEQTTDKIAPYLFSQCQAIHARSIVPCMDTPSVKATYIAEVTVPTGLACLMSAIAKKTTVNGEKTTWTYEQLVAIPSYLIAIVVGKLEKKDISRRCAVWAEPSVVDSALWEFNTTEEMLKTAESLLGKYVWGRYDMVVLPASFPFGGMENPCLTFVTPTLLTGDRSMVNVVAHEIAHSWSGNLVTNANWEHFWMNEGFTVFFERKIHGKMHGELERQFESECGWEDALVPTVTKVFSATHEFTKLIQNHRGIDPDDAFSSIPYEKGSALLFTVEQTLGDSQSFELFMRDYIEKYAYKTVLTEDWKHMLYERFGSKSSELDQKIDWDRWLNQPGLPPRPNYDSTLMSDCRALAERWLSARMPTDDTGYKDMSATQKVAVLGCIRNNGSFGEEKMQHITSMYGLNTSKNCEIQFNWLMLGLEVKWPAIITPAMEFVTRVGRLKYCKPIYKALFEWPMTSTSAIAQFRRNIPNMHPITVAVLSKLIPK